MLPRPRPLVFAGFPANSWAFALRIWLAMLLALYVSFWLELESPSSAALTVASWRCRHAVRVWKKPATGCSQPPSASSPSIAIAGMFSQTDGLLLAVLASGSGFALCGRNAGRQSRLCGGARLHHRRPDRRRADRQPATSVPHRRRTRRRHRHRRSCVRPGQRGSRRAGLSSGSGDRLEALHRRVELRQSAISRGEASSAWSPRQMLRDIAALHPEIASLTTESSSGTARTAAARTAMVDLVTELSLARALAALPRPDRGRARTIGYDPKPDDDLPGPCSARDHRQKRRRARQPRGAAGRNASSPAMARPAVPLAPHRGGKRRQGRDPLHAHRIDLRDGGMAEHRALPRRWSPSSSA